MRYLNYFIILLLFSCNATKTQKGTETKTEATIKNVLFIGNSLTYVFDTPAKVQDMLNETNPGINVEQIVFPGMSLTSHLDNIIVPSETDLEVRPKEPGEITPTEKKIKEKDWDIIIFQEGTISVYIPEMRQYKTEKAISRMKAMATNKKCKFILFTTWPTENEYPKKYCFPSIMINRDIEHKQSCSPEIQNLKEEVVLLNSAYGKIAKKLRLSKSNNANKVYEILTKHKDIIIHIDPTHQNANGAFLNACVFYEMISGKKATDLKYNSDIESNTAQIIKEIVSNEE